MAQLVQERNIHLINALLSIPCTVLRLQLEAGRRGGRTRLSAELQLEAFEAVRFAKRTSKLPTNLFLPLPPTKLRCAMPCTWPKQSLPIRDWSLGRPRTLCHLKMLRPASRTSTR
jgi:hypothetical protein